MSDETPVLFVVDDDDAMRTALTRMLGFSGFLVEEFASAQDFLARERPTGLSCLILDVRMPGMSGLTLQEEIRAAGLSIPIVFLTGHGDVPTTVQAMKAGAVDFLEKPVRRAALLDAVRSAIDQYRLTLQEEAELDEIREQLATLTPREREVLDFVVLGVLNKRIAMQLGITERTVKGHRANVMKKLRVVSVAELARLIERVEAADTRRAQ